LARRYRRRPNDRTGNVQRTLPANLPEPRLIIGREELSTGGGGVYEHHYPATGDVQAVVPLAGAGDVDAAVIAAAQHFQPGSTSIAAARYFSTSAVVYSPTNSDSPPLPPTRSVCQICWPAALFTLQRTGSRTMPAGSGSRRARSFRFRRGVPSTMSWMSRSVQWEPSFRGTGPWSRWG
jgi:hypothetical protein